MLLDNKNKTEDNDFYTVSDFLINCTETGTLDLVTGFFSVNALALMYDKLNQAAGFRMILGNFLKEGYEQNKIIDILNGNKDIISTIKLSNSAQKAVSFLNQSKVEVKNIQSNFCHAKTYIYTDRDSRKHYHVIGSSNLTDAGLGIKESSNIELNTASTGNDADNKELRKWFKKQWEEVAQEEIELPDKTKIPVKNYVVDLIKNLYKEYSPEELYYKVLYELFKEDLLSLSTDTEFKREIVHLEETNIYNSLFAYQQKGVISLIKMLQNYNGAILADAVGLGKTWTALAVMKYFEIKGYTIVVFCPKKLRNNWEQYQEGRGSRFEKDEIDYYVRNHTDLQEDRLTNNYPDFPLTKIQRRQKLLVVIDESHNLRNDKSSRYKFLVDYILMPDRPSRDVKILQLSATPINNKLIDIRNQFKLMVKGADHGFEKTNLEVHSLENIFRVAQADFKKWSENDNRKISQFIAKLPQKFFSLTDALIVARTRKLIESEFGLMNFPKKQQPINEYVSPGNIGQLKTFDDILSALRINLTAYRPSEYIKDLKPVSVLENPQQREKFLAKMMYILLMKRLEASWHSFKITVDNILNHHINALNKVDKFIQTQITQTLEDELSEEMADDLEEAALEFTGETEEQSSFTLGKKNPVALSSITNIELFRKHLMHDVEKLKKLKENLEIYEQQLNSGLVQDEKLKILQAHIQEKQRKTGNKKVLIFTVFKDTAQYLFRELKKLKNENVAYVSGSISETDDGYSGSNFEPILERFSPFTKLYNEKDWTDLFEKHLSSVYKDGDKWKVPYNIWEELIKKQDPKTANKLKRPVDILIATDCLSEGQNLQDCDCVINYDIHWNPVRLIQRIGRIDRLGSPNQNIIGINFWPGDSYEDYLRLKSRVENRMALMSVVGTELTDDLTPEFKKMVEENPLLPKQAEKMLQQLQFTWDDVEDSDETLGLDDLSLEQFRQELFEFFKKNEEFFKKIPNGVFTGFNFRANKKWKQMPNSVVAVLGYPKRPDDTENHIYKEIHLLHQSLNPEKKEAEKIVLNNNQEILTLLRYHKLEHRYVPKEIDTGDKKTIVQLSEAVIKWLKEQVPHKAANQIQDLFTGNTSPQRLTTDQKKLEEKYRAENFDLINWFIVTQ